MNHNPNAALVPAPSAPVFVGPAWDAPGGKEAREALSRVVATESVEELEELGSGALAFPVDESDKPGPVQAKAINKAARSLLSLRNTVRQLSGVIGGGERWEKESEAFVSILFGEDKRCRRLNAELASVVVRLRALFGAVSRKNARAVENALILCRAEMSGRLPVEDKRETLEQYRVRTAKRNEQAAEQRAKEDANEARILALFEEHPNAKPPQGAKRSIVAFYEEDESDCMTDYFATKDTRAVLLGYSTAARESFALMRACAKRSGIPEIQALADAGPDAEHRDNFSMGRGNWLGAKSRYCSGWYVREYPYATPEAFAKEYRHGTSRTFEIDAAAFEKPAPAPREVRTATDAGERPFGAQYEVQPGENSRGPIFLAVPVRRLSLDVWKAELERAKACGGWSSRAWQGQPGGYGFETEDAARAFAAGSAQGAEGGAQ